MLYFHTIFLYERAMCSGEIAHKNNNYYYVNININLKLDRRCINIINYMNDYIFYLAHDHVLRKRGRIFA